MTHAVSLDVLGPLRAPGDAHIVAVYLPGFAMTDCAHCFPAPHVDVV
jgi:hypothetical protein